MKNPNKNEDSSFSPHEKLISESNNEVMIEEVGENPKKEKKAVKKDGKMARRYELAYKKLYDGMPAWKKVAIQKSIEAKRQDDYILNDFIHAVAILAEDMADPLLFTA